MFIYPLHTTSGKVLYRKVDKCPGFELQQRIFRKKENQPNTSQLRWKHMAKVRIIATVGYPKILFGISENVDEATPEWKFIAERLVPFLHKLGYFKMKEDGEIDIAEGFKSWVLCFFKMMALELQLHEVDEDDEGEDSADDGFQDIDEDTVVTAVSSSENRGETIEATRRTSKWLGKRLRFFNKEKGKSTSTSASSSPTTTLIYETTEERMNFYDSFLDRYSLALQQLDNTRPQQFMKSKETQMTFRIPSQIDFYQKMVVSFERLKTFSEVNVILQALGIALTAFVLRNIKFDAFLLLTLVISFAFIYHFRKK